MFDTTPVIQCAGRSITLDRTRIMGVVNVTPDSFSDGGQFAQLDVALKHALELHEQGADILDIGGESTRPGAKDVSESEEVDRVLPLIERLRDACDAVISIDTSKPSVMRAAVAAGAGMINDVYALQRDGALSAAAELGVPVALMHMQGEPRTMQDAPAYADVVADVHRFLTERIFACEMSGIAKKNILIDPGFGFGKKLEHNLQLLAQLRRLVEIGVPLIAGVSRKSMIGELTGRELNERVSGSVAAALIAAQRGAAIVRVHDVAETLDALKVWRAVSKVVMPRREAGSVRIDWDE